jgi:hypothetical protein
MGVASSGDTGEHPLALRALFGEPATAQAA